MLGMQDFDFAQI